MDILYDVIPHDILQMFRINVTMPIYFGNNKVGNTMANWDINETIELLQKCYHQITKKKFSRYG